MVTADTTIIAHALASSRAIATAVTRGVRGITLQVLADNAMKSANEALEALKRVEAELDI